MKKTKISFLIFLLTLILLLAGCGNTSDNKATVNDNADSAKVAVTAESNKAATAVSGKLVASFIDVGQGDSELLQLPNGQNMLIDAGIPEAGPTVVSYLKSLGIQKIDYIVATHPHADHIGGMELVVKSFSIGKIYMTRGTTNTETFKDLLGHLSKPREW